MVERPWHCRGPVEGLSVVVGGAGRHWRSNWASWFHRPLGHSASSTQMMPKSSLKLLHMVQAPGVRPG